MSGCKYSDFIESNRHIYWFREDYKPSNIKDAGIDFGPDDIAICDVIATGKQYIYLPNKDVWVEYYFPNEEPQKLLDIHKKSDYSSNILVSMKRLLFEIYSAGYEAGMQNTNIVDSYNSFYKDILGRAKD